MSIFAVRSLGGGHLENRRSVLDPFPTLSWANCYVELVPLNRGCFSYTLRSLLVLSDYMN